MGAAACGGGDEPPPKVASQASVQAPMTDTSEPSSPAAPAGNAAPRIVDVRFEPERPTVADSVRAVVETADAEGDPVWLRYVWEIAGASIDGKSREISLQGAAKGARIDVTVVANDGKNESNPRSASTVIRNAPPRLERVEIEPGSEIVAGRPIVARPDARDADGDAIRFRYRWTVNGRQVSEEGAALSTEDLGRGDTVQVEIVASDASDDSEPLTSPKLTIVNAPPRILSLPVEPSHDGTFRYRVSAEDPDGDVDLQFHLEQAPDGMRIDALTGAITWAPSSDQLGTHTVSVVVDDLQGGRTRRTFEVTVGGPADAAPPAARAP
jgi:hypothetical protein